MKLKNLIPLAALLFASCAEEQSLTPSRTTVPLGISLHARPSFYEIDSGEQNDGSGGGQTRANAEAGSAWADGDRVMLHARFTYTNDHLTQVLTTFDEGDVVHILRRNKDQDGNVVDADYNFTASVSNGATTWTAVPKPYWNGVGEHTLIASHPSSSSWDKFQIPSDQSSREAFTAADCMNARWTGSPTTETISFALKHRLSMVTVSYRSYEYDLENTEITPEVYSKTQFFIFTDDADLPMTTPAANNPGVWVKPYKYKEGSSTKFSVIVSPGAYAAGDEFIRVYIGDDTKPLIVKMPKDITFYSGVYYTFTLQVGKGKHKLYFDSASASISGGWSNEEELK